MFRFGSISALLNHAWGVRSSYKKPLSVQFKEILSLRSSGFNLSPAEYYEFRLFRDDKTVEEKKQYVGWRFKELTTQFCDSRWSLPLRDKVFQQLYLEQCGLAYPRIQAVCGPHARFLGQVPFFMPDEDFARFLCEEASYPFFSKPLAASMGRDGIGVLDYDENAHALLLSNGEKLPVARYLSLLREETRGTVIQEMVKPHPETIRVFGDRLSSVRILTLLYQNDAKVQHVSLRIPTGVNMTDNFTQGKHGNMVAQVNLATGEVEQVLRGVGLNQQTVSVHPDTGEELIGFIIPNWSEMISTVLRATMALPGLYVQNWDVAIGHDGPILLEVNFPGDVEHLQHAHGQGIFNQNFADMLSDWDLQRLIK